LLRNVFGVIWLLLGAGSGYWSYTQLERRYAKRAVGRFVANWAFSTGLFAGLGGLFMLWNGGRGGGEWNGRIYVGPYQWQWTYTLAFALVGGFVFGALVTSLRQPSSYAVDISSTTPIIDDEEVRRILEAERQAAPEECRGLAEKLVAESRLRQEQLPHDVELFVRRHLPGRLTNR
jgi:hypothetical protein